MKLLIGYDYFASRQGTSEPIYYDTSALINGHMIMVGSSGVGKSYTIIRMLDELTKKYKVRVHVFDVHGDLKIPGASTVIFSESAQAGLNPLHVNEDPDYGGVRKCIQTFIRVLNQAMSPGIGVKQEAVLRNLLTDVFREFGFHADDPSTWALNALDARPMSSGSDNRVYMEVPFSDKEKVQALGARWDPTMKHWWVPTQQYAGDIQRWPVAFKPRTYPTLADVAAYCNRIYEERFLGSDQQAVRALQAFNRKTQALQRRVVNDLKLKKVYQGANEHEAADLERAREDAIGSYTDYVKSVRTGYELENLLKYDSIDTLKSVANRLDNLLATGLFKAQEPRFSSEAPVWRYKLDALSNEEKKMYVLFKLEELYYSAVQRGVQNDVVEVVVLDELGTYTSSADNGNGDGIIGVIAREARKYGLALWGAHQQTNGIPESLMTSVGTKIVLGLDDKLWPSAITSLRIESKLLDWIQPGESLAAQFKNRGSLKNRWRWTNVPSPLKLPSK